MRTRRSVVTRLFPVAGGLLLAALVVASPRAQSRSFETFLPARDLTAVGVYYYPGHRDSAQWERDFRKVNYSDQPYEVALPPGVKPLIGERNLATAGVLVWKAPR